MSRRQPQPQSMQSGVGFYLMPPDDRRGSKKRSQKRGGPGPPGPPRGLPGLDKGSMGRRYASHNQLDSIAEASDESGQPSPDRGGGDPWSSSPGKIWWGPSLAYTLCSRNFRNVKLRPTVWKFKNSIATKFYVKSILAKVESQKLPFNNFRVTEL